MMPLGVPIPPSPAASEALLTAFAERGIAWHPGTLVASLDPAASTARLADGTEMPFDSSDRSTARRTWSSSPAWLRTAGSRSTR